MMSEEDTIAGLVDVVLPGGNGFPGARTLDLTSILVSRLRAADSGVLSCLNNALAAQPAIPAMDWIEATRRLEATEPKAFGVLLKYAYLTYYEQPAVIEAIRALGFTYNHAPLPDGYPTAAFDPAMDAPKHGRGKWVSTANVTRVDVESLGLEDV